jgi:hypothetical protein
VFDPRDTSSMRINYGVMLYKAASVAAHHPQRVQHQGRVNGSRGGRVMTAGDDDAGNEQVDPQLALMTAAIRLWSNEVYTLELQERVEARAAAKRAVHGGTEVAHTIESQDKTALTSTVPKQNVHASLEQVKHIVYQAERITAQQLVNNMG